MVIHYDRRNCPPPKGGRSPKAVGATASAEVNKSLIHAGIAFPVFFYFNGHLHFPICDAISEARDVRIRVDLIYLNVRWVRERSLGPNLTYMKLIAVPICAC